MSPTKGSGLGGGNREARKIVGIFESDEQSYTPFQNLIQARRILARLVLIRGGRR
jgi:hypothetical protein